MFPLSFCVEPETFFQCHYQTTDSIRDGDFHCSLRYGSQVLNVKVEFLMKAEAVSKKQRRVTRPVDGSVGFGVGLGHTRG